MKNKMIITAAAAAMTTLSASAGETYSAKEPVQQQVQESARLQWFIGASGGYLLDAEEEMYHFQVGVKKQYTDFSHALYLEVGYVDGDEDDIFTNDNDSEFELDGDTEIVPITLNYKYSRAITNQLSWFVGGGAGIALVNSDTRGFDDDFSEVVDDSIDDAEFYAQAFAGLTYKFTPNFEVFGGARYIYVDTDADLIDDDTLVELGLRYNF